MNKFLVNPFFLYILSFSIALTTFSWGWSGLYPSLSSEVVNFFLVSFLVAFFFGVAVHFLRRIEFQPIEWDKKIPKYVALLWLGYILEFIYNGSIPLFSLTDVNEDRVNFGIPTFHVFLVTFGSFFSVVIFHHMRSGFTKSKLFYFLLSVVPGILILNRGMILMVLTSCLFIFLLSIRRLTLRPILAVTVTILVVLYLFGIVGNVRQSNGKTTASEYILDNGQASSSFRNSPLPSEYFWAYLYASSPMANFQQTVNNAEVTEEPVAFATFELLPDFFSKRMASFVHAEKRDMPRVAPWLTVSTFYARSFVYLGWWGVILLFLYFLCTSFLYLLILRKDSPYYSTGLALLCTVSLYNTFDNMYAFTGLQFQLIYPLILTYVKFPSLKWGFSRFIKTNMSKP